MANGNIKGITIQFNGDTTRLDKALREINSQTRALDKELKAVDNALKFNPTNIELWRQKQDLLSQKVAETKTKLDALKQAQAQMDASGVDKNSAEYRQLQRQIIITENQAKTFEGQLKQIGNVKLTVLSEQFKDIGSKIEGAGQKMKGLSAVAAGVTASIGALAIKSGQAADDINTLSKVTGIGTKDLQKYGVAADLVDVSVEAIAKSNKKLVKTAYQAANGSKSASAAFEKLGVSVTDQSGNLRDSEDIFQDVITALGQMTNETERDALAQTLMGKSAAELNPLIEDGGETYKQVAETLQKYNLDFIDQETLDKANKFNDELDTMKIIGTVAFQSIGAELAGYLAPTLEKVVGWVGKFAEWLGNLDPTVLTIVASVGAFLAVLAPLLITIGKLATGISAVIKVVSLLSSGVGLLSSGALLPIIAVIAAVIAAGVLLYKNWDTIKAKVKALGDAIKSIWNSIVSATKSAWNAITKAITTPFTNAFNTVKSIISKIKNLFPINVGNLFKNVKLPHFSWEWTDLGDTGISIPTISIDWYKNGGIFDGPSIIGVGEAGSEAVVPLDKFWSKLDAIADAAGGPVINVYATPGMDITALANKIEQILIKQQKQRATAYGI